jgi:hypothetical protein
MPLNFYTPQGKAYAYTEDKRTIYTFNGKPIAYIDLDSVYAFTGKHLGFFEDGNIRSQRRYTLVQ